MEVKFICLNLWQGGNLFEAILQFLREEDADIIALQEVYDGKDESLADKYRSLEVIRKYLGPTYYFDFAPAFLDNRKEGKIAQGNAIFSRFPIKNRGVTFFNEPYRDDYTEVIQNFPNCPRNLEHVVLQTHVGEVNIFNFQGVWDLDGDNYSVHRQKMSEKIIDAVSGKSNVILAGDTNSKPTNQAMRNIEQHLVSVFGNTLKSSFNMRRKTNPGYATAAVDLMYVSSDVQVLSYDCRDVDISDHQPLVAKVRFSESTNHQNSMISFNA